MPLPQVRLRTLLIVVPLAGVVLAIEVAAWLGKVGEGLQLVLLMAIAWVPPVFLLLDPKVAGWLLGLAVWALFPSLALSLYSSARDCGYTFGATLWLTIAFGIGYVATKGLHLPDRRGSPDAWPEADARADRDEESLA
jgi:hypothetical protein